MDRGKSRTCGFAGRVRFQNRFCPQAGSHNRSPDPPVHQTRDAHRRARLDPDRRGDAMGRRKYQPAKGASSMTYEYGSTIYTDGRKVGTVVDPAKLTKAQLVDAIEHFENHAVYLAARGKARIFDTDTDVFGPERVK